jgi:hypothetical protein
MPDERKQQSLDIHITGSVDSSLAKALGVTHNNVEEKAATFRVYARLHQLQGDDAAAYVDWALDRLAKLRLKEHH